MYYFELEFNFAYNFFLYILEILIIMKIRDLIFEKLLWIVRIFGLYEELIGYFEFGFFRQNLEVLIRIRGVD